MSKAKMAFLVVITVLGIFLCLFIPYLLMGYLSAWAMSLAPEIVQTANNDINQLTEVYVRQRIDTPVRYALPQVLIPVAFIEASIMATLCYHALLKKSSS